MIELSISGNMGGTIASWAKWGNANGAVDDGGDGFWIHIFLFWGNAMGDRVLGRKRIFFDCIYILNQTELAPRIVNKWRKVANY